MCPWMLVVGYYRVYIPFSSFLSYRMCWAGLLQVGCVWEPSVAAQNIGPSLERGVVARASVVLHPVLDLRVVVSGSSELFVARAVCFFLRSIENFLARARVFCVWSLERPILRSSERVLYQLTAASKTSLFHLFSLSKT